MAGTSLSRLASAANLTAGPCAIGGAGLLAYVIWNYGPGLPWTATGPAWGAALVLVLGGLGIVQGGRWIRRGIHGEPGSARQGAGRAAIAAFLAAAFGGTAMIPFQRAMIVVETPTLTASGPETVAMVVEVVLAPFGALLLLALANAVVWLLTPPAQSRPT